MNQSVCSPKSDNRVPLKEISENTRENRINKIFLTESIDILDILDSTFEGRNIATWYTSTSKLTQTRRKKVVHLVMCAVLRMCERNLEEVDFMILRRKIVEAFPSEIASIYYSPSIPKNKTVNGKSQKAAGKLLHKYNSLKRSPCGVYKPSYGVNQNLDDDEENISPSEDEKLSIEWLRTLEEPWDTAKYHWEKTYKYRHANEEDEPNKLVSSIYEDWPILKCCKGHELIGIDFTLSGLCKEEKPMNNFSNFYEKVSQVRRVPKDDICNTLTELFEDENLNSDSRIFIELLLLSFMFVSNAKIVQGKQKYWKPSCLESFEGIITHVKTYVDIQRTKEERRVFASSKRITLQPYVIAVGEEDFKVDSTYLIIDDNEYEISTLSEAIDFSFQSFHVFGAKYPPQSQHLWLLLQHAIYKFRTRWDPYPLALNVDELMNDINFILPPLSLNKS